MNPAKQVATLFHTPPPAPASDAAPDLDAIIAAYREATSLARFTWSPYMSDPKLEGRLHRIPAQTLVVAPDDDRVIPVEHARRYAELIPSATYAEVAGCGHAMYFERPDEFTSRVAAFLNSYPLTDATSAESGASR
jgi:pimeloyl-ACP methyl ester carboxylesterase